MDRETFLKVRDGLGDHFKGLGLVWEPSQRFGMGRRTLMEVRDGSGDPSEGL